MFVFQFEISNFKYDAAGNDNSKHRPTSNNMTDNTPESKTGDTSITLRAVVDRIEDGDLAVLMVGEDEQTQLDVPRAMLPPATDEGAHLRITIKLDREARSATADRVKALQEKLRKGSEKP